MAWKDLHQELVHSIYLTPIYSTPFLTLPFVCPFVLFFVFFSLFPSSIAEETSISLNWTASPEGYRFQAHSRVTTTLSRLSCSGLSFILSPFFFFFIRFNRVSILFFVFSSFVGFIFTPFFYFLLFHPELEEEKIKNKKKVKMNFMPVPLEQ